MDKLGAFFDIINPDPVISQVKLIAEPWDVGEGGYQVGKFPPLWAEWNGRYRDVVRRYWKADDGQLAELGYRLTGSSDLYQRDGRHPTASINFITAHDGFTLADLVSYNNKRNEANGEHNADGENHNLSWNCGAEGDTPERHVLELRARQRRNLMATLLFSVGVPMLSGGDEMLRTQGGNNNAYCQDNPISWTDWTMTQERQEFLAFTRRIIRVWRDHPVLRRRKFFQGRRIRGAGVIDIAWLDTAGVEMTDEMWNSPDVRGLGVRLNGDAIQEVNERGERIAGDTLLLLLNAGVDRLMFVLPPTSAIERWDTMLDTSEPWQASRACARAIFELQGRSMAVLRLNNRKEDFRRADDSWGPQGVLKWN